MPVWPGDSWFRGRPYLAFLPGLVLLASVGYVALRSSKQSEENAQKVSHSIEVISKVYSLRSVLESAESSQRGYLITRSPSLLQRMRTELRSAGTELDSFMVLTADNAGQQRRGRRLNELVAMKSELLESVASRSARTGSSPLESLLSSNGSSVMESIRFLLSEIEQEERQLWQERNHDAERTSHRAYFFILLGIVVSFIFVLYAAWLVRRELRDRRKAQLDQIEANRMAAQAIADKSQFLANISHEIRTPLHTIIGMTECLSEELGAAERAQCYSVIRRSSLALHNLVNDILDLSKAEAGKLDLKSATFAIRECLENCMSLVEHRARLKGISLSCELAPDLPRSVVGDGARLQQILLNLLGNAVKFTHEGGVSLKADLLRAGSESALIRFTVSDTGIGIPPGQQEFVYEKFNQLDRGACGDYGGTGLGLAIVRHLTGLMNGKIAFHSEENKGTTFELEVPFGTRGGELVSGTEATLPLAHPARRILVADDVEDNRILVQFFLKGLGHELEFARNGQEAVSVSATGEFDLVLMDLHMPGIDGFEAIRKIREREKLNGGPEVPILALTAAGGREEVERSQKAGASGHLSKPISKLQLVQAINAHAAPPHAQAKPTQEMHNVRIRSEIMPLIPNFLTNRKKDVCDMRSAVESSDLERLERLAHSFKGVTGSFGFRRLFEIAADLQDAVKKEDTGRSRELIEAASDFLENVKITYD